MESKPMMKHSTGQILILTALTLVVLLGLSALTIDLGMAYAVQAKLNSAVDAASLAAGKAVKIGADDATRRLNATNAANSFFSANFPTGIRSTTASAFSVDSITSANGTWTIKVSASTTAPTFFSSIFNLPIRVGASAEATVKTLDLMLVLDCSGSLGSDFSALQDAAVNFINGFQEGVGGDRIGVVTFASGAVLNDPINKDANRGFVKSTLVNHINAASMGGATNAEEAMRIAKAELDAIPADLRSTLRAIVFFSDGAPNIVSGRFKLKNPVGVTANPVGLYSVWDGRTDGPHMYFPISERSGTDGTFAVNNITRVTNLPVTDYTGTVMLASFNGTRTLTVLGTDRVYRWANTWCDLNKAARNMVENIADAARGGAGNAAITIYSIGLGDRLQSNEVTNCAYGTSEYGENIMKRLANTTDSDMYQAAQPTGIYVWAANATQLNSAFQRVRSAVLRLSM
jgi:Flp pilus assembly protein TadG